MLQRIRDNVQGWLAKAIIAIIIVPFAAFGINAFFGGGGDPDVAKVNGEGIKTSQLNEAIYAEKQRIINQAHGTVSADELDDGKLRKEAMKSLVGRTLLEQAADNLGVVMPVAMSNQYIQQMPQFQEDGKFSQTRLNAMLRAQGINPVTFKQNIHNALLFNQLMSFYTNATIVTPGQIERAAAVLAQKRNIAWVSLPVAEARKQVSVSDAELRSYYDAHKSDYKTQDKISVKYIEISLRDFYPDIPKKELRQAYEDEVQTHQAKVQRRASHILIATSSKMTDAQAKAKAEEIRKQIENGADFAAMARKYSDDKGSAGDGGDLGYTDGSVFPKPFEAALSGLKVGHVSQPVKTEAGWHLIKLTDVRQEPIEPFADAKNRLREQLQKMKAKNVYATKEERLADLSFNAPDLASVAKQMNLNVQTSPLFTREGTASGVFANKQVLKAAFSKAVMQQGANSDIVDLPNDRAIVVRLDQHKPPEQLSFDDVRDSIRATLVQKKAGEALQARASQLITEIGQGKSLKELAEAAKLDYHNADGVARGHADKIPPAIASRAFELPPLRKGASAGSTRLKNGDVAVVVVTDRIPGSVDDLSLAEQRQLRRLLEQYHASRYGHAYEAGLRAKAEVKML